MLEERRFFVVGVVYIIGAMLVLCIVAVVACIHVDVIYSMMRVGRRQKWCGMELR